MLNAEQSMEITVLHRHGMSIRALVDITGCARNTIRKYLRSEGKPALKERAKRTEKLDPFKPYLIRRIESACKVWSAGVQASPLGKTLAEQSGIEVDRAGRVPVEPDLTLPGHPNH